MNLKCKSDVELVEAYLRGETKAFDEIYRRYRNRLIIFVYDHIMDWERSLDLVQETFLRVSDHLTSYDQTRQFQTWIYTIAKNLARNHLRNRRRNPILYFVQVSGGTDIDDPDMEDPSFRPDELLEREDTKDFVWSVIGELNPDAKKIFIMRDIEGEEYVAISQKLGVNLGTVKSRLFRARTAFREKVLERAHLYKGS